MSIIYKTLIRIGDRIVPNSLRPFWEHPVGPKTIFFWAPTGKWTVVFAGLGDLNRPPEQLSIRQAASLAITGAIWSRWALIIIPKNYNLFLANVFVFLSNSYQVGRAVVYQQTIGKNKQDDKTKK